MTRHTYQPAPGAPAANEWNTPCSICGKTPDGTLDHAAVCGACLNKHGDYRSPAGHLAMDPKTGATVLEPHRAETFSHSSFYCCH